MRARSLGIVFREVERGQVVADRSHGGRRGGRRTRGSRCGRWRTNRCRRGGRRTRRSRCIRLRPIPRGRIKHLPDRVEDGAGDALHPICCVGVVNDAPRRFRCVGQRRGALPGLHHVGVATEAAPLIGAGAPAAKRIRLERLQPLALRLPVDVDPDLDDGGAVVRQGALELRDAPHPAVEHLPAAPFLGEVEQRRTIPAAQKERHEAARRERAPIAPEAGALQFLVGRLAPGPGLEPARVHPGVQFVGGLAPVGSLGTGKDDKHRAGAPLAEFVLRREQAAAERGPGHRASTLAAGREPLTDAVGRVTGTPGASSSASPSCTMTRGVSPVSV